MTEEEKNILLQWIDKATHDLLAAQILIEASPLILDIACFHCQQSIEKYLKAFLILHNRDFGYTHNLDYLLGECAAIDEDFANLDMKNMNLYAVRARYPHDHLAPDMPETREYYQIAIAVQTLVKQKMML